MSLRLAGVSWHPSIKGFTRASSEKAMEFHSVNMENDNDNDCNEDSDSGDDGSESEDESDDEEVEVVGLQRTCGQHQSLCHS